MRFLKLLLRILGWLLTPLVAWAASFIGASIGAVIARGLKSPTTGMVVTAACGAVAGSAESASPIANASYLPLAIMSGIFDPTFRGTATVRSERMVSSGVDTSSIV